MNKTWKEAHILLTKPLPRSQGLVSKLSDKGASVLFFPTLSIQEAPQNDSLMLQCQRVINYDYLLFVSPNAVLHGMPLLKSFADIHELNAQFGAVGAGTKDTLNDHGVHNVIYPLEDVGGAALLSCLPPDLTNKKIAVFRGDTGTPTLEDGLMRRGAFVEKIVCYRRLHSSADPQPLAHAIENQHIDLIVTTSGDGLKALCDLIPYQLQASLTQTPVVVVSTRTFEIAHTLGFEHVLQAKSPSDDSILDILDQWFV